MLATPCPELKKPPLSIDASEAAVKAPDELQRELMMLEYMSKLKRKSDDRKPEGGKQKTCANDNK